MTKFSNNWKDGDCMTPETLKEIENFITSIGFPIVCVIFMWKKITDSDEKQTNLLTELTLAIKNLTEWIKGGEKK
jgi:hypothetical protein